MEYWWQQINEKPLRFGDVLYWMSIEFSRPSPSKACHKVYISFSIQCIVKDFKALGDFLKSPCKGTTRTCINLRVKVGWIFHNGTLNLVNVHKPNRKCDWCIWNRNYAWTKSHYIVIHNTHHNSNLDEIITLVFYNIFYNSMWRLHQSEQNSPRLLGHIVNFGTIIMSQIFKWP
jgi:hypothetical protein